MKRISIVAIAALMIAMTTTSAQATGFELFGVDGLIRFTGFGYGQGYHSLPKNPALRHEYRKVQNQRFTVVPPPAYPCSPRAPEHRGHACSGLAMQQPMVQYAAPMGEELYSPDPETNSGSSSRNEGSSSRNFDKNATLDDELETKNSWDEIPELNKKKSPARNPAENSPKREAIPTPSGTMWPTPQTGPRTEDMLDEMESYFGDGIGPGPSLDHQSSMRRLPAVDPTQPVELPTSPPTDNEFLMTQPSSSSRAATTPGATPDPKATDVWW